MDELKSWKFNTRGFISVVIGLGVQKLPNPEQES